MSAPTEIAELATMDRPGLIALWQDLFGRPVPKGLSRSFLRRFLAFELQSRRHGGVSRRAAAELARKPASTPRPVSAALRPGARLLREWNGVTHVVDVGTEGFTWNGRQHRSLSAIAREITGARWSGPRFFGLKGTPAK